jgi:hypothetical protein
MYMIVRTADFVTGAAQFTARAGKVLKQLCFDLDVD